MIELIVDGQVCDLGDMPTLPLNFDAESLTDVEGGRSGRTVELNLPSTPKNDTLFGASSDNIICSTGCVECEEVLIL